MSETEEKNKALVRRFLEAMAKGDLAVMDEMMAPTSSTSACYLDRSQIARASSGR